MNIDYSKEYLRSLKRILKRRILSKTDIDETVEKFKPKFCIRISKDLANALV